MGTKAVFVDFVDGDVSMTADEVIVDEEMTDTGLLDEYGNRIFRTERVRMGFL